MSATPVFAVTPRFASGVTVATLDTVRGAAGSATGKVTIITGAASGTRINKVRVVNVGAEAGGAPTAAVARFWIYDTVTYALVSEVEMAATAPTSTAAGARKEAPDLVGLILPSASYSLVYGISTAGTGQDAYMATVEAADI